MNSIRGAFAWVLVAVMLLGLIPSRVLAQQPAQPSQPDPMQGVVREDRPTPRGVDGYDVGAGVVTVLRLPFNIALCAVGTAVGTALFALTLGSGYKASTRVVEEGCAQKWLVRGHDLRPSHGPPEYSER
jgi:hypothetical protein